MACLLLLSICLPCNGNWYKTAKKGNAENLLIITDYPELIQQYVKNWEARMSQSYKYATN
jgi:ATP phosphoribosyltransferase